jgi:Domain of unknown function (DUF1844)
MSEEKKPFTVTDRRHFTREGDVRAGEAPAPPETPPDRAAAVEEPRRASAPPAAPHPAPPPLSAAYQAAEDAYSAPSVARPDDIGGGPGETLDFVGLLLSLGTQASMMLGLSAAPGARPGPPDLGGARSIIGLLEVLRDKTEGRRTAEEEEVLQGLLYELRMQYVALARKGGP